MSKHSKRLIEIQKIAAKLDKIAQQLRLPGIQEPQLDLPGIPLEVPQPKKNLPSTDFNQIQQLFHNDLRKIIRYEIQQNPTLPKDQIADFVVNQAKENLIDLLDKYIDKIPELKAKLPKDLRQMTLTHMPPEIQIFPTQKEIEEDKARLKKDLQEEIKKYDTDKKIIIDEYKIQHNGAEPTEELIKQYIGYRNDPRKNNKPQDIDFDLKLTQGQYKDYLNKLYSAYYKVEKNYNELDNLYDKLNELIPVEELPAVDPNSFTLYKEMIYDLKDRTILGMENIIRSSVGFALFGMSTGENKYNNADKAFFNNREFNWLNNPDKLKEFLEKIPRVYDYREKFWGHQGYWNTRYSPDDISFWFDDKYNKIVSYNQSLEKTKQSFAKGIRFLKTLKQKLSSNVDEFLKISAFKYSEYIDSTPEHRNKLNELYSTIVKKIHETSQTLGRASRYDNGLYSGNKDYEDLNLGKILAGKNTQVKIIESLTNLLTSSIKNVAKTINENEIGPSIDQLCVELSNLFLKEKINIDLADFPSEKVKESYYSTELTEQIIFGDRRLLKVADAWLKFASSSRLSLNFNSIVKYPEFIYRDNPEAAQSLIELVKIKLGYFAANLMQNTLPQVFSDKIREYLTKSEFVYRGTDELRKEVFLKKHILFNEALNKLISSDSAEFFSFNFRAGTYYSIKETPQRYSKLRALVKDGIEKLPKAGSQIFIDLASLNPEERAQNTSELNSEIISNRLVNENLASDKNSYRDIKRLLQDTIKFSALMPLKENIIKREQMKEKSLIFSEEIVPNKIHSTVLYVLNMLVINNESDWKKERGRLGEQLRDLKLPTEISLEKFAKWIHNPSIYNKTLFGNADMSNEEFLSIFKKFINEQEELNKQFNDDIEKAILKISYQLEMEQQISIENSFVKLFADRLRIFQGAGPNAINAKFQELHKSEKFKHLPFQKLVEITNDETIKEVKNNDFTTDKVSKFYNEFNSDEKQGTSLGAALAIITNKLNIKDPNQIYDIYNDMMDDFKENEFRNSNISREEVEYIFPVLITDINAISSQIKSAFTLAGFAHNEGQGIPKETILKFAQNPNFKDWTKEVDAIEIFFKTYIKIQRMGGPRKIFKDKRDTINALIKTKAMQDGFLRRMQVITEAFNNGMRISPSIEGFDSIKKMINQVSYDLNAIEKFSTFSKYNEQIAEQKLFKDPQLFKLNWDNNEKNFRFRVLKTFDPYHFQVGVDTNCCQKLGGIGEDAAIDSYINPLAGVAVLEIKIDNEYKIAAQSYFHYVPTDNGIILDNVEVNRTNSNNIEEITGYDIDLIYALWAKNKKDKNDYKYFLCGSRYNKLDDDKYKKYNMSKDPRNFQYKKYTDWGPNSSLNLLSPKFELPEEETKKKKRDKRAQILSYIMHSANFLI